MVFIIPFYIGDLANNRIPTVLPSRTALLRVPMMQQVILEDWLLETPVS
jgi:hypothetical protein